MYNKLSIEKMLFFMSITGLDVPSKPVKLIVIIIKAVRPEIEV